MNRCHAVCLPTGSYNGVTYSGTYGDLEATTVAVLMHSEARTTPANANSYGALREPYLKAGKVELGRWLLIISQLPGIVWL